MRVSNCPTHFQFQLKKIFMNTCETQPDAFIKRNFFAFCLFVFLRFRIQLILNEKEWKRRRPIHQTFVLILFSSNRQLGIYDCLIISDSFMCCIFIKKTVFMEFHFHVNGLERWTTDKRTWWLASISSKNMCKMLFKIWNHRNISLG